MYLLKKLRKLHKLSANNDKKKYNQSIQQKHTHATRKDLTLKKKKLKVTI